MFSSNPTLFESLAIISLISLTATVISKYVENLYPFHKKQCGDGLCPTLPILIVRFIHYFVNFLLVLYLPFFSPKFDLYYLIGYSFIVLHWIILNDCYLSNLEISLYDNRSELGSNSLLHPHFRVFVGDNTDYVVFSQILVMTVSFIYVLMRMKNTYFKFLFGLIIMIIQFNVVLKGRIENWLKKK